MNRQLLLTLFVCALALAAVAQAQPDIRVEVPTEAKPWTGLDLNNDPGVFRFAVVSDNAGGPREGIFAEAIAKLNLLQPEFVINVGDLIEGYEDTREALEAQWERRMAEIARLEVPFFFVPGNHDNGRPLWAEVYNARFGVPYYHFLYKDVLFLCLSTNTGPNNGTGISPEQIEYAARVLKEHPDVRWTIVFQHKPLWNENNEGWKKIEALLQGRKCTVFAGHTHNYLSQEKDGISYITLATTGGGSPLRGTAYGEFDQIAWVTMTDEGPRVANLLLDGIHDKSLRSPESAEALAVFREGRAVTATPILNEGAQFHTGATRLSIKNPADKPLRVKVLSEVPAGVRVEPSTVSMIVPPKSEEWAELKVTADQPVPLPAAQPVVLHWSAAYDSATNTPSVELSGECRVPVDGSFPVPAVESSPRIDGKLDDWSGLPFVIDEPGEVWHNAAAWKGPQDGRFRFGVARDEQYLYVGVKAVDNQPSFDGWKYWEDFALLFVDARASGGKSLESGVFSIAAGPQFSDEQAAEYSMGQAPEGVKKASQPTADGFEAEFAIPLAYLNEQQGGDWQRVRLNVGFSDYDTGETRDGVSILYWRPQWTDRARAYPEAGTFVK